MRGARFSIGPYGDTIGLHRRGRCVFDPSKYADHGVQMEFLEQELRPYPQLASPFVDKRDDE
jgi:hypothetical protein